MVTPLLFRHQFPPGVPRQYFEHVVAVTLPIPLAEVSVPRPLLVGQLRKLTQELTPNRVRFARLERKALDKKRRCRRPRRPARSDHERRAHH